ncbi:hypothetical protein [Achromobacter xylosoxidans]|uniref:hypothetical protein n=1 Tax=Alcaligenes xylosoxydans xylosoxydans TaxID=85698 RepID=UPI0006C329EF|nr:hypothetical protein [Achromobacter xylosoxidans]MCH4591055.1 hypothetical protein [Achromobacter xylosoxidans]CUJ00897.1 Uncharacterised protein [Achromobacter xylosoxidans]
MNPFWRMAAPWIGGAAVVLVLGAGVVLYGSSRYHDGIAKANADHALAELNEFKAQTGRLAAIATTFEANMAVLRAAAPKIIERYTRVEVQSPLPAGCRIDAGRLQHINEAVRLANSAGQPGPAVPAGARVDQR